MQKDNLYTTKLKQGLGFVEETRALLELWEEGMTTLNLYQKSLKSGVFPNIAARSLLNIVKQCFAARYLVDNGRPAKTLKILMPMLTSAELQQFLLLFTCRANLILADFIKNVYWEKYAAGYNEITNEDSLRFVEIAIDRGLTVTKWSDTTISRISGDLTSCCADYGLLEAGRKSKRKILPFRISPKLFTYLVYDLHFSGLGDNSVLEADEWRIFGLEQEDVLNEMKKISTQGHFIVQSAGNAVRISWQYRDLEEVANVIAKS